MGYYGLPPLGILKIGKKVNRILNAALNPQALNLEFWVLWARQEWFQINWSSKVRQKTKKPYSALQRTLGDTELLRRPKAGRPRLRLHRDGTAPTACYYGLPSSSLSPEGALFHTWDTPMTHFRDFRKSKQNPPTAKTLHTVPNNSGTRKVRAPPGYLLGVRSKLKVCDP